jgi:phosphoribosylformylglycinamidine synthase
MAQVGDQRAGCRSGTAQGLLRAIQALQRAGRMLAYHDRSDGGLFATLCEMALLARRRFAELDGLCYDPLMNDVDGSERARRSPGGFASGCWRRCSPKSGRGDPDPPRRPLGDAGPCARRAWALAPTPSAAPTPPTKCASGAMPGRYSRPTRAELQQAWSEVSFQIASLRDDPDCAREEFDALADAGNPGLSVVTQLHPGARSSPPVRGRRSRSCESRASTASRNGRRLRARRLRALRCAYVRPAGRARASG